MCFCLTCRREPAVRDNRAGSCSISQIQFSNLRNLVFFSERQQHVTAWRRRKIVGKHGESCCKKIGGIFYRSCGMPLQFLCLRRFHIGQFNYSWVVTFDRVVFLFSPALLLCGLSMVSLWGMGRAWAQFVPGGLASVSLLSLSFLTLSLPHLLCLTFVLGCAVSYTVLFLNVSYLVLHLSGMGIVSCLLFCLFLCFAPACISLSLSLSR